MSKEYAFRRKLREMEDFLSFLDKLYKSKKEEEDDPMSVSCLACLTKMRQLEGCLLYVCKNCKAAWKYLLEPGEKLQWYKSRFEVYLRTEECVDQLARDHPMGLVFMFLQSKYDPQQTFHLERKMDTCLVSLWYLLGYKVEIQTVLKVISRIKECPDWPTFQDVENMNRDVHCRILRKIRNNLRDKLDTSSITLVSEYVSCFTFVKGREHKDIILPRLDMSLFTMENV